jgi:formylglycine-generating enzyme required for sulfatase activity
MIRRELIFGFLLVLITACSSGSNPAGDQPPRIDTGVDSETWALVPAGTFLSGQHNHETLIDYDYAIMVTDVTNAQFAAYLSQALADGWVRLEGDVVIGAYPGDVFHAYEHEMEISAGEYVHVQTGEDGPRIQSVGGIFTSQPGFENHPVVQVSWFGARGYCEYYGWRLPLELEWEKAARGPDDRPYPWGNEIDQAHANFYSSHDLFEKMVGGAGGTTPVGFYSGLSYQDFQTQDSASPYGLYDMAGNVWQWTGDIYEDQHYRYMRGGSLENYAYNLRIWTRNSASPTYASPSLGFRCARDP